MTVFKKLHVLLFLYKGETDPIVTKSIREFPETTNYAYQSTSIQTPLVISFLLYFIMSIYVIITVVTRRIRQLNIVEGDEDVQPAKSATPSIQPHFV